MNRPPIRRWTLCAALLAFLPLLAQVGVAHAQPQQVGAATVYLTPRGSDKPAPRAPFRTEAMLKQAAPTSQWYSTLIFNPKPEAIYAQPLAFKATTAGLEMSLPGKVVFPTDRQDVEIIYPHDAALTFRPEAFEPEPAKLARVSDWAIDISMARGADQLLATVAHGSPYAYFRLSRGDIRITLAGEGERLPAGADARALVLRVKGKTYAVFGPNGVRWEQGSVTQWIGRLPAGAGYFSATALPDDKPQTLQLLARHAYAFVHDTRVQGRYDMPASRVETTFTATTQVMEGPDNGPLLGLYPHHWHDNAAVSGKLGPAYDTVRGPLRLLAASSFKTERPYTSFVPHWPKLSGGPRLAELDDHFKRDLRRRRDLIPGRENTDNWRVSAYWQGKGLTRLTQLAAIAEQQGDMGARDQFLAIARERMEWWFGGKAQRSYLHLDKGLGTVVAYPDEFFHVEQMNDHHFWFGYWIRAAAEIALRDPAWAAKDKWGGVVDLLVADIATSERGRADFPYLRNFDPYEGHSWAVGIGGAGDYGGWGNNQESSSEALNAWAGLILWGEVTGNRVLRDLGVVLLTTESEAIAHYWFDMQRLVFAREYKQVMASMVFGAKYAHNTWWTDEPRQIHGINLLPIASFSTYLARDPAYIKRNLAAMDEYTAAYIKRGRFPPNRPPADIWQDIFAKYLALADPAAALASWNPQGSIEDGDSRTHTLHWMLSLQAMGTPDFSVRADTTLYAVFKRPDGARTYLAFNAGKSPLKVSFSDGKVLEVAPGELARAP
jgi:endoglucanase Acf2